MCQELAHMQRELEELNILEESDPDKSRETKMQYNFERIQLEFNIKQHLKHCEDCKNG